MERETPEYGDIPAPFVHLAAFCRQVPWFSATGAGLSSDERKSAQALLDSMGFPDVAIVPVPDWGEAAEIAANPGWNTDWWEAEEQRRIALAAEAARLIGDEETLLAGLNLVSAVAGEAAFDRIEALLDAEGTDDPALLRAATGAAAQAAYQAALMMVCETDEDHPFYHKFRLFEAGRWPLGVVGQSLSLF